jgi:hypothetical protein
MFRALMLLHVRDNALWRSLEANRPKGSLSVCRHPIPVHEALISCR